MKSKSKTINFGRGNPSVKLAGMAPGSDKMVWDPPVDADVDEEAMEFRNMSGDVDADRRAEAHPWGGQV